MLQESISFKSSKVNVQREIKEFLDYVETEKTSNSFLKKLDREVKKQKRIKNGGLNI